MILLIQGDGNSSFIHPTLQESLDFSDLYSIDILEALTVSIAVRASDEATELHLALIAETG